MYREDYLQEDKCKKFTISGTEKRNSESKSESVVKRILPKFYKVEIPLPGVP